MKRRFASQPADVGSGFSVEFTFQPGGMVCESTPDVPGPAAPKSVFKRYAQARDDFIAARMVRFVGTVGDVQTEIR